MENLSTFRLIALIISATYSLWPSHCSSSDKEQTTQTSKLASVVRITPEGSDVPQPSQIVIQFAAPVVPLGRMDRTAQEIAVKISPPLACQWRWLNSSALACNMDERNRPTKSTTYSVTIPPVFDSTTNTTISREIQHSFTTERPAVLSSWYTTWTGPGSPQIGLSTNQRVSAQTLESQLQLLDSTGTRHALSVSEMQHENSEEAPEPGAQGTLWTVTPTKELLLDTAFQLMITPGLSSLEGKELGAESRQIAQFHTFAAPRFLGISCLGLKQQSVWIPNATERPSHGDKVRTEAAQRCDPLNAIQLVFNSPVLKEQLKDAVRSTPDLTGGRKDFDPWQDVYSYSRLSDQHVKDQRYAVNLPYGLKAFSSYSMTGEGAKIHDEFGRPLSNDISVSFLTDHRRPRYVLDNSFSVFEKDTDSKLPVVVNNVDSLRLSYQSVTTAKNQIGLTQALHPYKAQDIAYRFPIDIRGILEGRSGIVQGTLATKPATSDGPRWFFSQVTPYAVHFKLGHFNSLAWVTSLSTGKPIPGAKVSLTVDTLTRLAAAPKELASASTDEHGVAFLSGTETIDPKLTLLNEWENSKQRLVVRVNKEDDMALVPLSWDMQVYSDVVYPSTEEQYGHIHAWGTTAQGLYKAGDTVQFALWVRNQDTKTLIQAPREGYTLKVFDPSDSVVFEVPELSLSEFGGYSGEFTTRTNAPVGWYRFALSAKFSQSQWQPLRVLISDFTPAPFKVTTELNAERFRVGEQLLVTTQARLHAGGPYADAMSRITARIKAAQLTPTSPALERFTFESDLEKDKQIFQREEALNSKGDQAAAIALTDDEVPFGNVVVESAVRDDRGKFVTSVARKPFLGRDRYVGVAQGDWILQANREANAQVVVVNDNLEAVAGSAVIAEWFYEETKAARVKSAGNSYITKYEQQFIPVQQCNFTSTLQPIACAHTPQRPGRYKITATVKDTRNRIHASTIYRWASGAGEVVWSTGRDDELPIIPEKKSYKIGETARFFIRNPFPGSTALLTTERYGIQRQWTQSWPESSVVVEVPVTQEHIPGVFFSATVTSPRVDKPIENQVDLGKPSFKMGYAAIEVVDTAKQLAVDVKPRASSYKPNETVEVDLSLRQQESLSGPVEFAVTVLDEAVFDLLAQGKNYFDPYKGFYQLDGLDVRNYNLIKMLLGRQNFEKKGASPGGDGGSNLDLRSLKKFVSYWNPSIRADMEGRARISFQAPENLTGWKVFAIALTKDDKMGLGEGSFAVSKEVEIRSALPNQVRAGDTFNAVFTVMNRTGAQRTLTVEASVEGGAPAQPLKTTIMTEPFKRYPIVFPVSSAERGQLRFSARVYDAAVSDGLTASVPVLEQGPLTTAATFNSADGKSVRESVTIPQDIVVGSGSIGALVSSSVIGGLEGSFSYMKSYPYECWEQRISKAVMAMYSITLRDYLPKNFEWKDAEQLIRSTLLALPSFQTQSGGMSFYLPQDEYANPYLSAYTALALGWLREAGYQAPAAAERKLHEHIASLLKNDTFPEFFSLGMRSSVRAMIVAALAQRGLAKPSDLLRSKQALASMSLFGQAYYLQAAITLDESGDIQQSALNRVLAHATESGATFRLTDTTEADSERMLGSEMRSQCAALSALLKTAEQGRLPLRKQVETIIPKLVRSITTERKRKDRWENTQENLLCMTSLAQYSQMYELGKNEIQLSVATDSEALGTVTLKTKASEAQEISRPLTAQDPGRSETITISPSGPGRFYYSARLSYLSRTTSKTPRNAGIEVSREYSVKRNGTWVLLANPVAIKQGELVKVDIFLKLTTPKSFVVVDDPVPGGLEAVNRDLATSSEVDSQAALTSAVAGSVWWSEKDWITFGSGFSSFYHKELRHNSARFYSEYLPIGHYHLSYVAQAVAAGNFAIPPLHAEEMYDPDVFGESGSDTLRVEAAS